MNRLGLTATAVIFAVAPFAALAGDDVFNRIATFPIFENLGPGQDPLLEETVAEIVAVASDNMTLVYTDSAQERIGFVNIVNPAAPAPAGFVDLSGEPTSVIVVGDYAYAGADTTSDLDFPEGYLSVIDVVPVAGASEVGTCDLPGQPDSVAASPDGAYLAVVLENQRDEGEIVLGIEGGLPQLPAGELLIFELDGTGVPTNCLAPTRVALTGGAGFCLAPTDPEPEFVDINSNNVAVVTLQENNCNVLVDVALGSVIGFSDAGTASLQNVDITEEDVITLVDDLADVLREPDAVGWIGDEYYATANEGDLDGGSRGFTIYDTSGAVAFESFELFEHLVVQHGHYPEGRSENKGNEPEGIEVGIFDDETLLFVGSERSGVVGVYEVRKRGKKVRAKFRQMLPTGYRPEGLLAIPSRDLFVVAAEEDALDDKVRAAISIYAYDNEDQEYPTIVSRRVRTVDGEGDIRRLPIPWGALSGLAPDRKRPHIAYSVHDSAYGETGIFKINLNRDPALILSKTELTRNGELVNDLDLEGITQRRGGGFWLVSEGNDGGRENLLIRADSNGVILEEIQLPVSLKAQLVRFGLEGVTVTGRGANERVYVAFQREWNDDPDDLVKIGQYNPNTGDWAFFHYPIEAPLSDNGGWVGLSSIDAIGGDWFVVIERDNQAGALATIKRLYVFSIAGLTPLAHATPLPALPVVSKSLLRDLIPDLEAPNGQVLEKVEGLSISKSGELCIVNDNDAVDDSNGETQLLCLGEIEDLLEEAGLD